MGYSREEKRKIFEIIKKCSVQYSVKVLCGIFGVSKSGYYDYLKRGDDYINNYKLNFNDACKRVKELHKMKPSRGYRRLNELIKETLGWVVTDNYIHKVCKFMGIKSKAGKYVYVKQAAGDEHEIYERILRTWDAQKPFEKVTSDTTMITFDSQNYDFTFYLDVFSREIISYDVCPYYSGVNIEHHMRALRSFLSEKEKRGYINLDSILHTDQGAIYTSKAFNNALIGYNIIRSMSRAATPKDNGLIESTNRWIKAELYLDTDHSKYNSVYELIDDYVFYYNYERKQRVLENKSPIDFKTYRAFV